MRVDDLKESLNTFWDNLSEGWRHLRQSASNALTRFKPGDTTGLPAASEVDDAFYLPWRGWSMLDSDVFEDEKRVVVRLELPGMEKEEIKLEMLDGALLVAGEKRFERETSEGRWRVLQRAYGSFRRVVPLPVRVKAELANATYRNGVLRVELPKLEESKPERVTIEVT
jgi:HSP20 family protein